MSVSAFLSLREPDKGSLLHLVEDVFEACWKLLSLRFGEQSHKQVGGPTKLHFLRQAGPKQTAGLHLTISPRHMLHVKQRVIEWVV